MAKGLLKIGASKTNYRVVVLVNERYKIMDCRLSNERLWSSDI
jgi:hypothetical protein